MKNNLIIITVLVAIVSLGGGYFAGIKSQPKNPRFGNFQGGRNAQGQARGFRPVNGEILNSDDKSVTVKLADGSSKIVILSSSTSINKSAEGTREDLKTGEKVAVFGIENPDGSVTAQNIQLNPMFRGLGGPRPSGATQ